MVIKILSKFMNILKLVIFVFFRAWEKLYAVLEGTELYFYKDLKHRQDYAAYHNESPIQLAGSTVQLSDYPKRRHVISIKLTFGFEYLIQLANEVFFLNFKKFFFEFYVFKFNTIGTRFVKQIKYFLILKKSFQFSCIIDVFPKKIKKKKFLAKQRKICKRQI